MSAFPPELTTAISKSLSAQDRIIPSTPALEATVSNSTKKGLPDIAIGPAQGAFLSILCKSVSAKRILEIGTLGGYSTLWFATSSPEARVTSIEFNAKHRNVALENLANAGEEVKGRVEIVLGAALDVLPKLQEQERRDVFDFIFIDASWSEQWDYFAHALELTRKGGLIYVDNAVRQLTEAREGDEAAVALVEGVRKAVEEGKVQASLIPTLNVQKSALGALADGFLIASVL